MYEILTYVDHNDQYAARLKWSKWVDNIPEQCSIELNCKTLGIKELPLNLLMLLIENTLRGLRYQEYFIKDMDQIYKEGTII
jgi:hypothetical protein